jgi:hypothetical protein
MMFRAVIPPVSGIGFRPAGASEAIAIFPPKPAKGGGTSVQYGNLRVVTLPNSGNFDPTNPDIRMNPRAPRSLPRMASLFSGGGLVSRRNPEPPVPSLEWLREELRSDGRDRYVENNVPEFEEDCLGYVQDTLPEDATDDERLDAAWALYYEWLVKRISEFDTKVYRAVRLDSLDELRLDRLGLYWTWDEEAAEPYWGEGSTGKDYIIEGIVDRDHVDWGETLRANARHPDEKEVSIKAEAPIYVVSVREMGYDEVLLGGLLARANPRKRRR